MTPSVIQTIFAGITLLILWSGTVLGAGIWIMTRMNEMKREILADFNVKHESNATTVKALEALVIRHDVLLMPEFNGQASSQRHHRT